MKDDVERIILDESVLQKKISELLGKVVELGGRIKKGMNETTKAIERKQALLAVIAGDVSPPEIVMHLPKVAEEQKIPYGYLNKKTELSKAIQIGVPCSATAVVKLPKGLQKDLDAIVNDLAKLRS